MRLNENLSEDTSDVLSWFHVWTTNLNCSRDEEEMAGALHDPTSATHCHMTKRHRTRVNSINLFLLCSPSFFFNLLESEIPAVLFLKTRNALIWVKEIKTEQWCQSGHIPEPGPPLPRTGTPHHNSGALTGSNDSETPRWRSSWQSRWVKAGATDEDHFPFYGPFPWSEAPKVYIHDASEGLHLFIFKQGMKLPN